MGVEKSHGGLLTERRHVTRRDRADTPPSGLENFRKGGHAAHALEATPGSRHDLKLKLNELFVP